MTSRATASRSTNDVAGIGPRRGDAGRYDLYLVCDDVEATVRELKAKGVHFGGWITQRRWGPITAMQLPGGGRLGLYEPRHASPLLPAG